MIGKKESTLSPAEVIGKLDVSVPSDPEFVECWMEEMRMRTGLEWSKFDGKCEMEFCDVRLVDGVEIGPCWPKGGKFVRLDEDAEIPFGMVTHVRYYEPVLVEMPYESFGEDEG